MKDVFILGVGGVCADIAEVIHLYCPEYRLVGFLDDDPARIATQFAGLPVVGPLDKARELHDAMFVLGLGSPKSFPVRSEVLHRLDLADERYLTVIHPTVALSDTAEIGAGTVLLSHCSISNFVRIEPHVLVLAGSVLNHDVVLGRGSILASSVALSGGVEIGGYSYIGSRAVLREGIRAGERCLVGAGSVVLKDVPAGATVVGNPARSMAESIKASDDRE